MTRAAPISVPKVEVFPDRLRLLVQLSEDAPRFADEAMVAQAYAAHPTLPVHSCINAKGPTFGDVAVGTSLPHLLEHLVIAEQVRILNGDGSGDGSGAPSRDATFVGTTHWAKGGPEGGAAVVEVSYADDLQALEALRNALALLDRIVPA